MDEIDQTKIQAFREQQAQRASSEKQDAQHQEVTSTLNNLLLATMVSKDPKMVEVAQNLSDLLQKIGDASESFEGSSLQLLPIANQNLAESIRDFASKVEQYSPQDLKPYFVTLTRQLQMIAGNPPVVNVPKQPVKVELEPLIKEIKAVQAEVKRNKVDIPKTDFTSVVKGLKDVQNTINGLRFPTPNYVLPFKNTQGAATQVQLDSSGSVPVSGTISVDTTGLATSAKQDTIIGHVDGVETLLGTVAGAVNGSSQMNVNIAASGATVPVSGTFYPATQPVSYATTGSGTATGALRVELPTNGTGVIATVGAVTAISNALPAGTNAIGKLTQPTTATLSNVTMTGSSVTLQASNTARRNLMIFNDSGVVVYVKLGSSASSTSFTVKMADQSYYELPDPVYTGIVTALGASGSVRVTEVE